MTISSLTKKEINALVEQSPPHVCRPAWLYCQGFLHYITCPILGRRQSSKKDIQWSCLYLFSSTACWVGGQSQKIEDCQYHRRQTRRGDDVGGVANKGCWKAREQAQIALPRKHGRFARHQVFQAYKRGTLLFL